MRLSPLWGPHWGASRNVFSARRASRVKTSLIHDHAGVARDRELRSARLVDAGDAQVRDPHESIGRGSRSVIRRARRPPQLHAMTTQPGSPSVTSPSNSPQAAVLGEEGIDVAEERHEAGRYPGRWGLSTPRIRYRKPSGELRGGGQNRQQNVSTDLGAAADGA
jgi:hypothetical protein